MRFDNRLVVGQNDFQSLKIVHEIIQLDLDTKLSLHRV